MRRQKDKHYSLSPGNDNCRSLLVGNLRPPASNCLTSHLAWTMNIVMIHILCWCGVCLSICLSCFVIINFFPWRMTLQVKSNPSWLLEALSETLRTPQNVPAQTVTYPTIHRPARKAALDLVMMIMMVKVMMMALLVIARGGLGTECSRTLGGYIFCFCVLVLL